jgi:hypothetical protein
MEALGFHVLEQLKENNPDYIIPCVDAALRQSFEYLAYFKSVIVSKNEVPTEFIEHYVLYTNIYWISDLGSDSASKEYKGKSLVVHKVVKDNLLIFRKYRKYISKLGLCDRLKTLTALIIENILPIMYMARMEYVEFHEEEFARLKSNTDAYLEEFRLLNPMYYDSFSIMTLRNAYDYVVYEYYKNLARYHETNK